jgi:NAD(P)-dependent dehydrogenase (short-subunit alcohol dehydrogenase family)
MPAVLITGASRGLGLEFARQYAADGWRVMACARVLRVNLLGPMKVAEAFVGNVAASVQKKIVTLTSVVGSISQSRFGGLYAYRSSKSAANSVMKAMSVDLKDRGIIAVPLHPGWVRTEIGGPRAELDVVESVTGMRSVIAGLTTTDTGRFLRWDGRELPW